MALSFKMVLMSCFSMTDTKARSSPTIKLAPKFKIRFMIIVVPTDLFKTPTTLGYFLCSIFFLALGSKSSIA